MRRSTWLFLSLALGVGAGATVLLRPNLVERTRGSADGGRGDPADATSAVPGVAVPAPAPPLEIPASMVYGSLRIGSLCPGATLHIGNTQRPIDQRGLVEIGQLSGDVKLEVRTPEGARWDTTLTVESGVVYTIGNRPLDCREPGAPSASR